MSWVCCCGTCAMRYQIIISVGASTASMCQGTLPWMPAPAHHVPGVISVVIVVATVVTAISCVNLLKHDQAHRYDWLLLYSVLGCCGCSPCFQCAILKLMLQLKLPSLSNCLWMLLIDIYISVYHSTTKSILVCRTSASRSLMSSLTVCSRLHISRYLHLSSTLFSMLMAVVWL